MHPRFIIADLLIVDQFEILWIRFDQQQTATGIMRQDAIALGD